ncbi:MAG: hypothetical protein J6Y20_04820 [Lachnospiraceae bacterium]|nr:hypothetical protein [Lachnospiraceae bacterium]
MRTISFKVYKLDELPHDARAKAIENCSSKIGETLSEWDSDDFRGTLDKLQDAFGIEVYNWRVGYPGTGFRWRWTESRWAELDEDPKYHIRYIDEVRSYLLKGKYYSGPFKQCEKSPEHPAGLTYKKRFGKTVFSPFSCCLTGVYSDWAVDDAMNKCYEAVRAGHTISDFIEDMLYSFFHEWEEDIESCFSNERVGEYILANDYDFTADGQLYS